MAAAIPIVISLAGAFMEYQGQKKQSKALNVAAAQQDQAALQQEQAAAKQEQAAEQSRQIAMKNAANIEAETAESVRRESQANRESQAMRVAMAAGGGGTAGGSTGNYLDTQTATEKSYVDWLAKAGQSRADIAAEQGDYSYLTGMAGADSTRAGASSTRAGASSTRGQAAAGKAKGLSNLVTSVAGGGSELYNLYS